MRFALCTNIYLYTYAFPNPQKSAVLYKLSRYCSRVCGNASAYGLF